MAEHGSKVAECPAGTKEDTDEHHVQDWVKARSAGSLSFAPEIVGDPWEVPALEQRDNPSGGADTEVRCPRARQVVGDPGLQKKEARGWVAWSVARNVGVMEEVCRQGAVVRAASCHTGDLPSEHPQK